MALSITFICHLIIIHYWFIWLFALYSFNFFCVPVVNEVFVLVFYVFTSFSEENGLVWVFWFGIGLKSCGVSQIDCLIFIKVYLICITIVIIVFLDFNVILFITLLFDHLCIIIWTRILFLLIFINIGAKYLLLPLLSFTSILSYFDSILTLIDLLQHFWAAFFFGVLVLLFFPLLLINLIIFIIWWFSFIYLLLLF